MTTLTIDRPASQPDEPRPCASWCTRHDAFGDVCTGRQHLAGPDGQHAVILTRCPDEPGDRVFVSVGWQQSVSMSPAEAIEFARSVIEQARVALGDIREHDRVTWTDHNGETATGTVLSIAAYGGSTHVRIDTDRGPVRPWRLITDITLDKLTRIPNAQATR